MRYYARKAIMAILFLFSGVLVLVSGLLQLKMNNYSSGMFQILVALLFAFDAHVYNKPYLGLDEEKLIINHSSKHINIILNDVTSRH